MIKRVKHYNLLQVIGTGGMGTVYKAEDSRNGRIVAVKELDPAKAQIEDYRERFGREDRILRRLDHPNIVSPVDAFAEGNTLYLVMEYVDGQSLDYKIRKISGPIPFIHARDLMLGMLEGFSHAHNAGVIHRDIKPANILISNNGILKITDFGISKITTGEDRTTANIKLGTLCYMSPEQLKTADVDVRSDIYGLGMSFYEMLAGRLPFTKEERENPGTLTLRISNQEPLPPPTVHYPHIPGRIVEIVMRMLEKDRDRRYSNLKEVLTELRQFDLSDPERTVMEEYEKTVAFDPTILTQGSRSDSEPIPTPSSSAAWEEKKLKEMTFEERQERAKRLEEEFREKLRFEEEEQQRKIEEEKRRKEEERRKAEEERKRRQEEQQRKEEEERAERERIRIEQERIAAAEKARKKKLMLRIGLGVTSLIILILVYAGVKELLYNIKYNSELSNGFVLVEGKKFEHEGKSWTKFEIAKIEVTQELWESVMGSNPSNFKGSKRPVEEVSWYDAVEFCNKLSEKEGLQKAYSGSGGNIRCDFTANGYRLPSEAEWEYVARGGNQSKGFEYSGSNDLDAVGWYEGNSGKETKKAGKKKPNELGIYDMSGNVWEWCWDLYSNSGSNRVHRGGSWYRLAEYCRVAYRGDSNPDDRYYSLGFRLVRTR